MKCDRCETQAIYKLGLGYLCGYHMAKVREAKPVYDKPLLLQEACKYKSYDAFIVAVQTKLGVYDPVGNRMPVMDMTYRTLEGESMLAAIHACEPGKGWFYVAKDLWEEAKQGVTI